MARLTEERMSQPLSMRGPATVQVREAYPCTTSTRRPSGPGLPGLGGPCPSSRFITWLSTKPIWSATVWRIDPWLLRLTRGRLGAGLLLPDGTAPETRGARTGALRRAVIYFHDGGRVIVCATQAGRPENPSWFYNARANFEVWLGGVAFRPSVVEDEDERTHRGRSPTGCCRRSRRIGGAQAERAFHPDPRTRAEGLEERSLASLRP